MTAAEKKQAIISSAEFQHAIASLPVDRLQEIAALYAAVPKPDWEQTGITLVSRLMSLRDSFSEHSSPVVDAVKDLVDKVLEGDYVAHAVRFVANVDTATDALIRLVEEKKQA